MKSIFAFLIIILIYSLNLSFAQDRVIRKNHEYIPVLIKPTSHDPNFIKTTNESFYQKKTDWQAIIDTTWGPGLPLANKLQIFDTYANTLTNKFDGILSLGLDWTSWDSLKLHYRSQIDGTTSRGGFAAIMTYFAMALNDVHTEARDNIIVQTPLNPGVPILATGGWTTVEHFGAVTTVLPDTSVLILRVVPNHPLGIQPGDIILGYNSIPYKQLLNELMTSKLPILVKGLNYMAAEYSAHNNELLLGAGMNWHLFDTIDILQYSTGNTIHLSVDPLINLNVPPMLNNEQMEIPGIPFPEYFNNELVTYGTLPNTNIGYIYLYQEWPTQIANNQCIQAVNALQHTDGLIIDMRFNLGGRALFDDAFEILFNESPLTLEDAYRCSPSTLDLCPFNNSGEFQITGNPQSIYDRPIAVLVGPNCVSMGDITVYRLGFHPMVKYFGKPTAASLGANEYITIYSDWLLHYSVSDMFPVSQPGYYLNRRELQVDFPVWHNKDDVANGIDAVVESALSWMNNMIYPYNIMPHSAFVESVLDTLTITANVANPNNHNINAATIINTKDGIYIDSLTMFDDGNHGDNLAGDGLYGCQLNPGSSEDIYTISASVTDLDSSFYHILPNANQFITIGPVVLDHYEITSTDTIPNSGNQLKFKFTLRNDGLNATAMNITSRVVPLDTFAILPNIQTPAYGDIAAGELSTGNKDQYIKFESNSGDQTARFALEIMSAGYIFWSDTFAIDVVSGLEQLTENIPNVFTLKQNYPNPFNPTTNIAFSIPKSGFITLKIYNLLGEEVVALVSNKLNAGTYTYTWDASGVASGIYYYSLKTQGVKCTRKMLVLR